MIREETAEVAGKTAEERVDPLDRGLHYGDGLFETLRVDGGRIPFLPWHAERLREGCRRLNLPWPGHFLAQAEALAARHPRAVLKFLYTAGPGERGYRRSRNRPVSRWFVSGLPPEPAEPGLRVRWCRHRLAHQPALAGIKHLNRLDQVLARAEWEDEFDEGILCDFQGHPVEGVQSNLFWVRDGVLHTPPLDACGVAGVLRRAVLAWAAREGLAISEAYQPPASLLGAEEVFLTNSVRGIQPVLRLETRTWQPGPLARRFAARLEALRQGKEALPA